MSSISDLAAVAQAVADAVARVDADLAALKAAIGNVTSLTPEDQAALDAAVAQLQGSVDAVNAADPPPAP